MRKMTYTEAATCVENIRVRVTPEQSEKMQKAWFAAGRTWADDTTEIIAVENPYLILHLDYGLHWCYAEKLFLSYDYEEIELIDDLLQYDFASQQEVCLWVAQGNKIKNIKTNSIIGFKDGKMHNFTGNCDANTLLLNFENWQKHTQPKLIRVNGVVVPAPLESLESGKRFWLIDLNDKELAIELSILDTTNTDRKLWLKRGLCYATKEDAIKRAEAMQIFEVVE
jgi:hypothetical protein